MPDSPLLRHSDSAAGGSENLSILPGGFFDGLLRDRGSGVPHDHREYVPGCFRCDLSRDEAEDADHA